MSIEAPLTSVSPWQISERIKPTILSPWITPAWYGMRPWMATFFLSVYDHVKFPCPRRVVLLSAPSEHPRVLLPLMIGLPILRVTGSWPSQLADCISCRGRQRSTRQRSYNGPSWRYQKGLILDFRWHTRKATSSNLEMNPSSGPKLIV